MMTAYPSEDTLIPFQLETSLVRGRMVRLDSALNTILEKHQYPDMIARLLAEALTLGALLAGMLKYEGIFTLQMKGDGPVSLMVVDVTSVGDVRGYAQFDSTHVATMDSVTAPVPQLFGKGYLAFTVDQGENTERYQGIVELKGDRLSDSVQHYFRQSEQLDTGLVVTTEAQGKIWKSAGIMLQRMPPENGGKPLRLPNDVEDDWRRAMVLLATCTPEEMLSSTLKTNDLLYRLFHEDGVRVYTPHSLRHACRCSRDRVAAVLRSIPAEELPSLLVEGMATVTCEFCNAAYDFDETQLKALKQ